MPEEKDQFIEMEFEVEMVERIESLIGLKKVENEFAIGRLGTMETSWPDVNTALDEEVTVEIDLLDDEADAIDQAKKRLERNICVGVDKGFYGIAGKVVDIDTNIGLPYLTVKVAISDDKNDGYFIQEATDSYGNFNIKVVLKVHELKEGESTLFKFDLFFGRDTIVHSELRNLQPGSGKIDEITLKIKCTGDLDKSKNYGKKMKESVESDAELVKSRIENMKSAYNVFGRLTETTLSFIGDLKAEIGQSPPEIKFFKQILPLEVRKGTKFLGNSNTRELHDLENATESCRLDQIKFDHRIFFKTPAQAIQSGYDFCAYCFGKDRSKR